MNPLQTVSAVFTHFTATSSVSGRPVKTNIKKEDRMTDTVTETRLRWIDDADNLVANLIEDFDFTRLISPDEWAQLGWLETLQMDLETASPMFMVNDEINPYRGSAFEVQLLQPSPVASEDIQFAGCVHYWHDGCEHDELCILDAAEWSATEHMNSAVQSTFVLVETNRVLFYFQHACQRCVPTDTMETDEDDFLNLFGISPELCDDVKASIIMSARHNP